MNKPTNHEPAQRQPFRPTPKRRRTPRRGTTVVISFSAPPDVAERVRAAAQAANTTVSSLLRESFEYAQAYMGE